MTIAPGTFIRLKQDPARAGILLEGEKHAAGARMVQVRLADGQEKWLPYSALEPVPSTAESVWDRFAAGRFVEPDWLRRTLTRLRVTGRLSEVVYVNGGGIMRQSGGIKMYHGPRRKLVHVVHGRAPRAGRRALRAAGVGPRALVGPVGPRGQAGGLFERVSSGPLCLSR